MEENVINYDNILEDCGVGKETSLEVMKNFNKLEEYYTGNDLVNIYNYILSKIETPELIIHIIKLADRYKNNSTFRILTNLLDSGDCQSDGIVEVRIMCAKAISNYKNPSSVTVFLKCLNNKNENYRIRLACADALGRLGDRYAVQSLLNVVEDEEEKSVYLKESATFALGLLGDSAAIDPLVSLLESKQGFFDKFSFLKEKIVEALGRLNSDNKKVLKALKTSLMDSSPLVRINAIEAIMNSGEENAADIIRPSLQDEDDEVKKNALIALYNLIGRDILDEVIELPIYQQCIKDEAVNLLDEYEDSDNDE